MKRFYFHCTADFHGDAFVSRRRLPLFPDKREPPIPRLCVCPTISGCLAAQLFIRGPVYVYRTARPVNSVAPRGVWDAGITGERWIVDSVELHLWHLVHRRAVEELAYATAHYIRRMKEAGRSGIPWRIRACQLAIAARVVGDPVHCFVDDPADYIIEHAEKLVHIS